MQTIPDYYYIPTGIDKDVADLIIKQCSKKELISSEVMDGAPVGGSNLDTTLRVSEQCWLPTDHWIAGMMKHWIESANTHYFHYDISKWSDQIQYTVYDGPGSKYNWHTDICTSTIDNSIVRKLSISLLLSDPSEYEGGEFQVMLAGDTKTKTIKPALGDAVIFPSTARHRVRRLKSGKRISLVGWYGGPAFR